MRTFLLAVAAALVSLTLTAAPAFAAKDWHTVVKVHGSKGQACTKTGSNGTTVYVRVDNRHGTKYASEKDRITQDGNYLGGGEYTYVGRHEVSPVTGNGVYGSPVTLHMTVKSGKHHHKSAVKSSDKIGAC